MRSSVLIAIALAMVVGVAVADFGGYSSYGGYGIGSYGGGYSYGTVMPGYGYGAQDNSVLLFGFLFLIMFLLLLTNNNSVSNVTIS